MFNAISVSTGKSARATLTHCALQPVASKEKESTTAKTIFIIEFVFIIAPLSFYVILSEVSSLGTSELTQSKDPYKLHYVIVHGLFRNTIRKSIMANDERTTTNDAALTTHLAAAAQAHGHICAGQVLGVRLAMLGLQMLGIEDPHKKDRKRLVTFVEIDRCATDAVAVVTGCRLGKRALKFRDWGKMAATFIDVSTGKAVRIAAKESSKTLARQMRPELEDKNQQQMLAYREMSDDDLFTTQWVKVDLLPEEFPGYKGERIVCEMCSEGINFHREVIRDGKTLCKSCAGESYYQSL